MSIHTATKRISDLHFENQLWLKEMGFYEMEQKNLEARLQEVVAKNSDHDMLAKAESFQNKFIRQHVVTREIIHSVKEHENWLAAYAEKNPVAVDKMEFADHAILRDRVETYKRLYAELRAEFLKWLINWI